MKYFLALIAFFPFLVAPHEFQGEWTNCNITKDGVIELYTTYFTKNMRYEVIVFGIGKTCNDIYKSAFVGTISSSTIEIKNNIITNHHLKDRIIAFDEETRDFIGTPQKCRYTEWINTLDSKCTLGSEFKPAVKDELQQVNKFRNRTPGKIFIKNGRLFEERSLFYVDGLLKSKVFKEGLFHSK
jgi:hypothetical protein